MLSRYQPATKTIVYPYNSWSLIGSDSPNAAPSMRLTTLPVSVVLTVLMRQAFTPHQTCFCQRLPPTDLPASRSRCDHGGGHRQHQDQDPPSASETTEEEECWREDEPPLKYAQCSCAQERIAKTHGSQCGFCTPGMVMSIYTLLRKKPRPTMEDITQALAGWSSDFLKSSSVYVYVSTGQSFQE